MNLGRGKKSIFNIALSLASQVLVVVVGLFLPRALIVNYGSDVNGLITSLQQIIAYLALVEGGIMGSAMASLYKPLSEKDLASVSVICSSAKRFYNKVGCLFLILVVVIGIVYPFVVKGLSFSNAELFAFVALSGVNGASQLFFIGKHKALLMASRNNGVVMAINALSTTVYSVAFIVLSYLRLPVLVSFSIASCAYLARAFMFRFAATKYFPDVKYDRTEKYVFEQQKDVLIQQVLTMVIMNSPVVIMTILQAPMALISVYTVYNLVISSVFMIFYSIDNTMTATFGDIVASEDKTTLRNKYYDYIQLFSSIWIWAVICLATLYLPFVELYTKGVSDVEYVRLLECVVFTLIASSWTLRNAQTVLYAASGRFRDLRAGFVVEATLCVVLSSIGFYVWGLLGLLIGRLISILYRVADFAYKNSRFMLDDQLKMTVIKILPSFVFLALGLFLCEMLSGFMHIDNTILGFAVRSIVCILIASGCSVLSLVCTKQIGRVKALLRF